MNTIVKTFQELTLEELYEILKLRQDVFMIEQSCPEPDLDYVDQKSYHVFINEDNEIKAYLRVIPAGVVHEYTVIGRVVAKTKRAGHGTIVMNAGISTAKEKLNATKIKINAQSYAIPFYEQFGFQVTSEEFIEANIPHKQMIVNLK